MTFFDVWISGGSASVYHDIKTCPRGGALPSFFAIVKDAKLAPCGRCNPPTEKPTDETVDCPDCEQTRKSEWALEQHREMVHENGASAQYGQPEGST